MPLMAYFAYKSNTFLFLLFLFINWFIDFIDGTVAKMLNQLSKLGYYLDTYLDLVYFVFLGISLYFLFPELLDRYTYPILFIILITLISRSIAFFKKSAKDGLHLWSGKMAVNFLFLFVLTSVISKRPQYLLMDTVIVLDIMYIFEEMIIFLKIKKIDVHKTITYLQFVRYEKHTLYDEIKKIPNMITLIRFFLIPYLLYFAYVKNIAWFSILFYIAFLSDQFDGIIARRLNQCSKLGSLLDKTLDDMYFFVALISLYFFDVTRLLEFKYHLIWIFLIFFVVKYLGKKKTKGKFDIHLYSGKFFQRYFYITMPFIIGYYNYSLLFTILIILGTIAGIEEIVIYSDKKRLSPDTKSYLDKRYNPFYYFFKYWP